MSEHIDLDAEVDRAWEKFQTLLADHLFAMEDHDVLVIESRDDSRDDTHECSPNMQFVAHDVGSVRGKIPVNRSLHHIWMLTEEDHAHLAEQGWQKTVFDHTTGECAQPAYYFLDKVRDHEGAGELSAAAVAVFRTMWGFAHPAFLHVITTGPFSTPLIDPEPPTALDDPALLAEIAEAAAEELMGRPAQRTRHGHVVVSIGEQILFLAVADGRSGIEIRSTFLSGITDRNQAAAALPELNRSFRSVRLTMVDDSVMGLLVVDDPDLSVELLIDSIVCYTEFAGDVTQALTRIADGRAYAELDGTEPTADYSDLELPPALLTLAQACACAHGHGGTAVTTGDVVNICGRDTDTLRTYLQHSNDQATKWRQASLSSDIRDNDIAAESDARQAHAWTKAGEALSVALRHLQRPDRNPRPGRQLPLFGDQPDPTLFDDTE